jgi:hypothetical protein
MVPEPAHQRSSQDIALGVIHIRRQSEIEITNRRNEYLSVKLGLAAK